MGSWQKQPEPARIPFVLNVSLSEYQQAIRDHWIGGTDNIHAEAVAGSGKSFMIAAMAGLDTDTSTCAYLSFNSDIVTQMKPKLPEHCDVKTAHAYGMQAVRKAYGIKKVEKDKNKIILKDYPYLNEMTDPMQWERMRNVMDLISKVKLNLVDFNDLEAVKDVADIYQIEIDCIDKVAGDMPSIFKRILEMASQGVIDFDDMLWIPVFKDLTLPRYRRLFIDEVQDFSKLMRTFALKMCSGKVLTVGDRHQSIYGFAGADTSSIDRMLETFGSKALPLSVCYRCPTDVLLEAQKIVPHIMPAPGAIQGRVTRFATTDKEKFEYSIVEPGSMILCRRNAPLVGPCFKLIKAGVKANIKGKNIAQGLIKLVETLKLDSVTIPQALDKVDEYHTKKVEEIMARKKINGGALEALDDNCDAIKSFIEQCDTTTQIVFKIHQVFDERSAGVTLSSIHRSKGLETDHVYIIDYSNVEMKRENQSEDAKQQERNLHYVALTRAKQSMMLIG